MWSLLEEARQGGWLIHLKREGVDPNDSIRGFVAAVSSDFVALSTVDPNCRFDGARVIQTEDVTLLQWDTEFLKTRSRVLEESPTSPLLVSDLDLSSWDSVIRSVSARHPVITFHRERVEPGTLYLGTKIHVEEECVRAEELSVEGKIDGHFALRLSDLTQIEFGDGYEQALWQMARNARQTPPPVA